jgi:hypothetical protein
MTISWSAIHGIEAFDATEHFVRSQALGLECPTEVFAQLFHDNSGDEGFASAVGSVDWANVLWEETMLSGLALRRVAVPRTYQHAVDEARWRTLQEGVKDSRPQIIEHWRTAGTWLRSPILVAGEVMGSPVSRECLVGFTRLGNLLGLLDRQQLSERSLHRVWLGRQHFVRHAAPNW